MQKSIRFFIMILPAFFARVKPVSTIAKPACIKNTSAAPMRNHTPNTSPDAVSRINFVTSSVNMGITSVSYMNAVYLTLNSMSA